MLNEIAVENFTLVPAAMQAGAQRIELTGNLPSGGLTPSKGVMAETLKYCHEHNMTVVAMNRPRGGDYYFNDIELKMMEADMFEMQALGVDAVIFGVLTRDNHIDEDAMTNLIAAAGGMDLVCNLAFDWIPRADQHAALDWLVEHGFRRILTHGGLLDTNVVDNIPVLQETAQWAGDKIELLPGGGVNDSNKEQVTQAMGVNQAHGTHLLGELVPAVPVNERPL
ncbi:copper homeostasis protein CutC [Lacticaseibacillus pantheris]|uniref:PF03932 family protein CutC n=1 Tax=Lacticaseibacillus pantheris DSM 15945 = JCM 12539 = NBRC 106106 TaxID=1423783 RepID=A0A0R1U2K7_9LACO|nr:copper homeostasis protein CutC [Lacticaseibacillus pantheris]KRL87553.1 copper resistance protein [Lacticaseibacillus pantheris DSM 15945 = JCM 12539 = NBRC 106106]WKF85042.1 copper homeostasis protein CutC [Lacticaseibacillus pantheris]